LLWIKKDYSDFEKLTAPLATFSSLVFSGFANPHFNADLIHWMRSSRVVESLTVNAVVATVLGTIPASSDTVESKAVLNIVQKMKKNPKKSLFKHFNARKR
jgi:hypothetical protein